MIYWFSFPLIFAAATAAIIISISHKRKNPASPLPELTDWDRKLMVYHEAGHAVCSYYLPEREPMFVITIDPSSDAFGMIGTKPRLHHNQTYVSMTSSIATFMGGRIAEEMFCNEMTTSCIHDLKAAKTIAVNMVLTFGMGKKCGFSALQNSDELQISEQAKKDITDDIQQILNNAEKSARCILSDHSNSVIKLANILLVRRTMTEAEINQVFTQEDENEVENQ